MQINFFSSLLFTGKIIELEALRGHSFTVNVLLLFLPIHIFILPFEPGVPGFLEQYFEK